MAYLTRADSDAPTPLVLLVHGGPWARDGWGFNAMAQWMANRGYAVLQVNYRGSSGYGKSFLHKGEQAVGRRFAPPPTPRSPHPLAPPPLEGAERGTRGDPAIPYPPRRGPD